MTGPGFAGASPRVRRWLGDVEPAWTSLAFESFNALRNEPSSANKALSVPNDLSRDVLNASAVARNALLLIRRAGVGDGLKLTATGNLTRSVVAEMIDLFEWPDFDRRRRSNTTRSSTSPTSCRCISSGTSSKSRSSFAERAGP